jgi:hypothetical protein
LLGGGWRLLPKIQRLSNHILEILIKSPFKEKTE